MQNKTTIKFAKDLPVLIHFKEPEIAYLFAELIEAQGLQAEIIDCINTEHKETRIITETLLFNKLPRWAQLNSLVVTDTGYESELGATTLVRPLDEERIEAAFSQFLFS